MKNRLLVVLLLMSGILSPLRAEEVTQTVELKSAPSPIDNPLKGLVPYSGRDGFPHSMEFNYIGFGELVKGKDAYDWTAMEKLLNDISSRGHQTVLRVYLEYPGKKNIIPQFLIDQGLVVHRYLNTNTQPMPPSNIETPDYESPLLRKTLQDFIAAWGAKYDGDPRIGFVTAGLLGTWGEWHTYPRNDLWASPAVQAEVLDAFAESFKKTRVLLRYPAGKNDDAYADTSERSFGYHDDSFAWGTLDTGRREDSWYFMPKLKAADLTEKWKQNPIGGEIRPEAWVKVFEANHGDGNIQDFDECVKQTHASWLMDSGMFRRRGGGASQDTIDRATASVRKMGYDFYVPAVQWALNARRLDIKLTVSNQGIAPFYYPWTARFALLSADGKLVKTFDSANRVDGILPAQKTDWTDELDLSGVSSGTYRLLLQVPNTLKNGHPIRFANETQNRDLAGWLTLGELTIEGA